MIGLCSRGRSRFAGYSPRRILLARAPRLDPARCRAGAVQRGSARLFIIARCMTARLLRAACGSTGDRTCASACMRCVCTLLPSLSPPRRPPRADPFHLASRAACCHGSCLLPRLLPSSKSCGSGGGVKSTLLCASLLNLVLFWRYRGAGLAPIVRIRHLFAASPCRSAVHRRASCPKQ